MNTKSGVFTRGAPNLLLGLTMIFLLASTVACTTQYYGYSKDQWQQMTPFEQEKAKVEWRQIIAAKDNGALGDPRSEISEGFVDYSENSNDSKE